MIASTEPVARIVLAHSETAAVFQAHRIDFCCRGEMTLAAACAERGLSTEAVAADLDAAIAARRAADPETEAPPEAWTVARLTAHLVERHHAYLREALPVVGRLAAKVARVHGEHDPRLLRIEALVLRLCETLPPHLEAEELRLFPALLAHERGGGELPALARAELRAMLDDHLAVGEMLRALRVESDDFGYPAWACNSYRTLFAELANLETDTLRHVHLENHALLPRYGD